MRRTVAMGAAAGSVKLTEALFEAVALGLYGSIPTLLTAGADPSTLDHATQQSPHAMLLARRRQQQTKHQQPPRHKQKRPRLRGMYIASRERVRAKTRAARACLPP